MTSDSVECVVISSTITGVSKVLLVDAEVLDVDPLCTACTLHTYKDHNFLRCIYGLAVGEFVLLDVESCLCNLSRGAVRMARSCRFGSFLPLQYSRVPWHIEASKPSIPILFRMYFSYTPAHRRVFVSSFSAYCKGGILTPEQSPLSHVLFPQWPHRSHTISIRRSVSAEKWWNTFSYHSSIGCVSYQLF